ncbi:rhodanese-like domain-containing protein, partial [Jeotgalibaca porci]
MFKLFSRNTAITTKELENDLFNKTVLDVRTPGEYRMGHISNAKNVPLDKIATYVGD